MLIVIRVTHSFIFTLPPKSPSIIQATQHIIHPFINSMRIFTILMNSKLVLWEIVHS